MPFRGHFRPDFRRWFGKRQYPASDTIAGYPPVRIARRQARHQAQRKSGSTEEPFRLIIIHLKFNAIMKTEEQKSAFILRVEEMVKEIETLMQEGGGQ